MNRMIEEEYFVEKLRNIPKKYMKYEPLKIEFTLKSPMCLTHPWLHFDSLIFDLLLKQHLQNDYYLLPSKIPFGRLLKGLDEINRTPIKKTPENLYFASVSIFNTDKIGNYTIYKRFEDRFEIKTKRKKISKGGGFFKDYVIRYIYFYADRIVFYTNGDYETLKEICSQISGLGNDIRIGWGAVKNFKIEKIEKDYSIIYEGKAMRPIPIKFLKEYTEIANLAWKSPYWATENIDICAIPGSEVKLGEDLERYIFES